MIVVLFYNCIGYKGFFILVIDVMVILFCFRVKGNRVIGVVSEEDIFVYLVQDIIDLIGDEKIENV